MFEPLSEHDQAEVKATQAGIEQLLAAKAQAQGWRSPMTADETPQEAPGEPIEPPEPAFDQPRTPEAILRALRPDYERRRALEYALAPLLGELYALDQKLKAADQRVLEMTGVSAWNADPQAKVPHYAMRQRCGLPRTHDSFDLPVGDDDGLKLSLCVSNLIANNQLVLGGGELTGGRRSALVIIGGKAIAMNFPE